MYYTKEFKEVVKLNTFIGMGNPKSKILILGKEVATDVEEGKNKDLEEKNLNSFNKNCEDWIDNIRENRTQDDIPIWDINKNNNNPLYAFKGVKINKEGHTWRKYQKLNNYIYNKENNFNIDFQEKSFISEISILPSKTTSKAQKKESFKESLQHRKKTFLTSDFIQKFPIVILACGNYINGDEITSIFDVSFIREEGTPRQKYWIHYNKDKTKLVIHTRQLSANISKELLRGIANEVKTFIKTQ